jgi:DNA modification methylase
LKNTNRLFTFSDPPLHVIDKWLPIGGFVTEDSVRETVAKNRRYLVQDLAQLRSIMSGFLAPLLVQDVWEFGLGEIDSPSLKLNANDPIPSTAAQKNHNWRISILSSKTKERIGHFVANAYSGEVSSKESSNIDVIEKRLRYIDQNGSLDEILPKSKKHREKMRRSQLTNSIIKGDSRTLSRHIDKEEIDLIFTSPPYFDARLMYAEYSNYNEYLEMLRDVFTECHKVLHEGRFIVVNISPVLVPRKNRSSSSKRVPIPFDIAHMLGEIGFEFVDDIQWVKPAGAAGHRGRRFSADRNPMQYKPSPITENILVYRKKSTLLIDWFIRNHHSPSIIQRSKVKDGYETTNVWEIQPANDPSHDAVFPLELASKVIEYYSFEDDVVLDPFAGIGTTGKAAAKLNRRFIMIDLDDEGRGRDDTNSYVNTMCERLPEWGLDPSTVKKSTWKL